MRLLVILALLWSSVGCVSADELRRFVYERAEMGVPFRITLYAAGEELARAAAEAAFERVEVLNSILSDYENDTELNRLARSSGKGKAVPVSTDLWRVLEASQALAVKTEGAFDVTVAPLVNLWRRTRRQQELPSAELLAEMRRRVGYHQMRLDPATRSIELLTAEMRLDLGAIAKGYAVDEALVVLKARGCPAALVAASGDIAAGDPPPGQAGWRVQIAAMDAPNAPPPVTITLANSAVATSGDTFQFVQIGGVRYSHILDPRTGVGLTERIMVSVVAPYGMLADGLDTAVSVLGAERGLALVESTPGAAARIVQVREGKVEVVESTRWKSE